jgi:hypothetical protein
MISHEHSPAARSEYSGREALKQGVAEETLKTDRIQIERKAFFFALKENPRGRFLRITEDINGRRDSIIVPATGLEEFRKVLEGMIQASAETPVKPE